MIGQCTDMILRCIRAYMNKMYVLFERTDGLGPTWLTSILEGDPTDSSSHPRMSSLSKHSAGLHDVPPDHHAGRTHGQRPRRRPVRALRRRRAADRRRVHGLRPPRHPEAPHTAVALVKKKACTDH